MILTAREPAELRDEIMQYGVSQIDGGTKIEIGSYAKVKNSVLGNTKSVVQSRKKASEDMKDGMDIALCVVDLKKMKMQYSGAYNPLYMFRNNELIETKADRMPIGIYPIKVKDFTKKELQLQTGDRIYLFSDGFQDQFGGEKGGKYMSKKMKKLLMSIAHQSCEKQHELMNKEFNNWMIEGNTGQIDDVCVIGVSI